ncbi:MAG: sel1 repeat family protein [Alphaproteobacteria bacterium]|nr:sel1 repeat family protein [Alphaproteobacteria bacterium]MDA8002648.1 sel1 repeat family protein [Alphaproteobacteria bacterium]MDA8010578.1 sel1 repeat family protein [Alphaproteobacteria bacterium]MDA8032090.1 sel1 repeat family protein [Alphaproteobacteria bacterium]
MKHQTTALILALAVMPLTTACNGSDKLDQALLDIENRNYSAARPQLEHLAEHGNHTAQYHLGHFHRQGRGVPQNDTTALKWFLKAGEGGNTDAQFLLGLVYLDGEGVPPDTREAAKWLQRAAENNDAEAQYHLGLLYLDGRLPNPQSKAFAAKWLRRAAETGHAFAQYSLAVLYRDGAGVTRDDVRAYMWLEIAAANGHQGTTDAKNELAARMTPEQTAKAGKLARRCRESNYKKC